MLVTVCTAGTYQFVAPTISSDRICAPCNGNTTYQSLPGQSQCNSVSTSCPPGMHETSPSTPTSDIVCSSCPPLYYQSGGSLQCTSCSTTCPPGYYIIPCGTNSSGSVSDATCVPCPTGQYKSTTDGSLSCNPISTSCPDGEYISAFGSSISDITCSNCTVCPVNTHIIGGCVGLAQDSQCSPCLTSANCSTGLYINGICDPSSYTGPQCARCFPTCASCLGPLDTACTSCYSGWVYNVQNGTCGNTCGSHYFVNNSSTCQACDSSCGTSCFGPLSSQCLNCASPSLLWQGSCLSACPNGTFTNVINGVCSSCSMCPAGTYQSSSCGIYQVCLSFIFGIISFFNNIIGYTMHNDNPVPCRTVPNSGSYNDVQ